MIGRERDTELWVIHHGITRMKESVRRYHVFGNVPPERVHTEQTTHSEECDGRIRPRWKYPRWDNGCILRDRKWIFQALEALGKIAGS